MSALFRIALIGFAPAEHSFVESVFQPARPDGSRHELVNDPAQADLILINADDRWSARQLRQRGVTAPVLLIGEHDAGTGWPVMPRPIETGTLLTEVARRLPGPGANPAKTALQAPVPEFAATEPFAPLEPMGRPRAGHGFEETRPFERPAAAAAMPKRPLAASRPVHDSINAQSVLLWRDAKVGLADVPAEPSGTVPSAAPSPNPVPVAAVPRTAPDTAVPAVAGFEPTRDADPTGPGRVPMNWRELARQRDEERRRRTEPPEAEPYSSSFADPSDHPTSPAALAALARSPAILLVGESRLGSSSLIRELRGLGCQVDHVQDAPAALARLAGQIYGFAFLDDRSLGRQTRAICRALRRRARALGLSLNIVVMARDEGPVRRLLARWAGCDTWMRLPLERKRLARYLLGGSGTAPGA